MKPINLQEFKALIIRYETIPFEEICDKPFPVSLTGFGTLHTCSLCLACSDKEDRLYPDCESCVYGDFWTCRKNDNSDSYFRIKESIGRPEFLIKAFWLRAKRMREVLKEKGINFNNENQ